MGGSERYAEGRGVKADPAERVNLAQDPKQAKTLAELKGHLRAWLAGFDRTFDLDP